MYEKKYEISLNHVDLSLIIDGLTREYGHYKTFKRRRDFEKERIKRLEELIERLSDLQGEDSR